MSTLYACIIRTDDDDILTDIRIAKDYIDVVAGIEKELDRKVCEVHMCSIALLDKDEQPTILMRDLAMQWINRHLE